MDQNHDALVGIHLFQSYGTALSTAQLNAALPPIQRWYGI